MVRTAPDYYEVKHSYDSMLVKTLAEFMTQYKTDTDWANIISAKTPAEYVAALKDTALNVLGAVATVSDNLLGYDDPQVQESVTTYTKRKDIIVPAGIITGDFRIKYQLFKTSGAGSIFGQIYKNGVAYGTETAQGTAVWGTKSEDLYAWDGGDHIELWTKVSAGVIGQLRNLRIYGTETIAYRTGVTVWEQTGV